VEALFDLGRALDRQPAPRHRRVHIVTNGGGLGILATDAARDARLELPPLSPAARASLARALPPHAALGNPLDLIGDATAARYDAALRALADDDAACVVMLAPQAATDAPAVARTVVAVTRGWSRPVLAVFAGGARVRPGVRVLEEGGIPCYPFPERAMRTLAGMVTLAERRAAVRVTPIDVPAPPPVLSGAARSLTPADTAALLRSCGIRSARAEVVPATDAARAAAAIGFPVALKIVSPAISHKTDVGGVRLGLRSSSEVTVAAADMIARVSAARPDARIDGVLVQEMAPADGVELLLGMVRDPQFGPLVMIGAGGIYVELLGDTATRLAPIGISEAAELLDELRLAPALRGARGRRPVDLEAVTSAVSRFSMVAASVDRLGELEINPLIVSAAGVMAIDARGTLE
jgi:acetyltransferase